MKLPILLYTYPCTWEAGIKLPSFIFLTKTYHLEALVVCSSSREEVLAQKLLASEKTVWVFRIRLKCGDVHFAATLAYAGALLLPFQGTAPDTGLPRSEATDLLFDIISEGVIPKIS